MLNSPMQCATLSRRTPPFPNAPDVSECSNHFVITLSQTASNCAKYEDIGDVVGL